MIAQMPRVLLVFLIALAWTPDAGAAAKWIRLRTPTFTLIGDASEGQIRDVARKLEQFRDALVRALPRAVSTSPVPTVVVVFSSRESMAPYRPLFNGKPVELAGIFISGDDVNYMEVSADVGRGDFGPTLHEYAHSVMNHTFGTMPVWANEGLAGLYQTFEERDGGKAAVIGLAELSTVQELVQRTPMPLRELLAIDHDSPIYNVDSRRGLFYAQSWALVHYLNIGNPARTPQFNEYLAATRAGTPSVAAAEKAFGDLDALQDELRGYYRRVTLPAIRLGFAERLAGAITARGELIDQAEVDGYMGDLLARLKRIDEATALLQKTLRANTGAARAASALGMIELRAGRVTEALPSLERAVQLRPDEAGFQRALGRALVGTIEEMSAGEPQRDATLQRVRQLLSRSIDLEPGVAEASVMLAYVEMLIGTDVPRAVTLLTTAVENAPVREDYRLLLAQALTRAKDYDGATRHLGPLVARGSRKDIRDGARRLLTDVATLRRGPVVAPAGGAVPDASAAAVDALLSPLPRTPAAATGTVLGGSGERPDLRPVGANETRVLGAFRAVECDQGAVVLLVQSDQRLLRLRARQMDEVDFIAYRADAPTEVNCGPLPTPLRVLATYIAMASAGVDGQAVAIELLPDGFTPPR